MVYYNERNIIGLKWYSLNLIDKKLHCFNLREDNNLYFDDSNEIATYNNIRQVYVINFEIGIWIPVLPIIGNPWFRLKMAFI